MGKAPLHQLTTLSLRSGGTSIISTVWHNSFLRFDLLVRTIATAVLIIVFSGLLIGGWGFNNSQTATAADCGQLPPPIKAVIEVYGGAQKLKEHREKPMRSIGTINSCSEISSAANTYECEILEKGNKVRVDMTLLGTPMSMGFDGQ